MRRPANQAIAARAAIDLASSAVLALRGKKVSPGNDLGMLLEKGAALTLGHAAPHTEFHTVVQRVGTALGDDRAVAADDGRLALSGAPDEQLVRISLATPCLRNPRDAGFRFLALHNGRSRCSDCSWTSRGLD